MAKFPHSLVHLSDHDLLAEVKRLAACERQATVRLIASLMEVDARRLYLGEGCSSLFTYCTQVLHLSEHAAYGRIEAARAAQRFPAILELLAEGAITLTTVGLLAPHLTADNHLELLNAARYKTRREVEHLVAQIRPRPDVATSVRKLPTPTPRALPPARDASAPDGADRGSPFMPPAKRSAIVAPLAAERYKVQFTVSHETFEKLRRAQDMLRHVIPNGDPAAVFDRALTLLLVELNRTRLAAASRPGRSKPTAPAWRADQPPPRLRRSAEALRAKAEAPPARRRRSRHIPAAVRRAVWTRDEGRCAFVGRNGRCTENGFLQFHHVMPFASGGLAVVENIELRCAAHNAHEAQLYFGLPLVRESAPLYVSVVRLTPAADHRHRCCANIRTGSGPS